MEMENRLAGAAPIIEDGAVAGEQVAFRGQLGGDELELAEKRGVARMRVLESREVFARANQDVRGGLRADVFEGEDFVILVHKLCGDLFCADFAEEAVGVHGLVDLENPAINLHRNGLRG